MVLGIIVCFLCCILKENLLKLQLKSWKDAIEGDKNTEFASYSEVSK